MARTAPHDTLGRRCRMRPISTGKRITLQPRDWLWLAKIAEHGPLSSQQLLAFSRHTHRSDKRAQERLTDLFNEANTPHGGPYLTRPRQQFQTIDARYRPLVYELAPAGAKALAETQRIAPRARSGPWWHSAMVASVTAAIELECAAREDLTYIPQSAILKRAGATLRWPTTIRESENGASYTKDLIPDAVFGLEHAGDGGTTYRFYALEADRGTEPLTTANAHRKSFARHLLQYEDYIERGGYRAHLQLTAPMLVLNVLTGAVRMAHMLELTAKHCPDGNSYQLFRSLGVGAGARDAKTDEAGFLATDWQRAGLGALQLAQ